MSDGSVIIDTLLDTTGVKQGLESINGIFNSSGLAKAGSTILKGVTAVSTAITAAGGFAVKTGMSFDSSMSQVMATMGLTGEAAEQAYKIMSDAAKQAGETTQFSAKESADALNYLALAGYDAEKAASVLPSVLNLAAAGGMDLAYASDLATDAMAALGIEATGANLEHFGDQMARTASRSNTSVAQLGEAILTVGGNAKQLAGGTVELNTALGILANRGIKGAEGGTHLRNVILSLTAPTDTAAKAIKKLGLQTTDASGNLRPLNEIMADFNEKTKGMSAAAKMDLMNQIFNKTDLAAVQALLAGTGEEWDNLTREIEECDGAMKQMADTQLDNLAGDVTIFKSALEGLGIAAYEGMDSLRELVQFGTEMLGDLTKAMKEGGFAGLAEALGDVLAKCITKIAEYIPKIVSMAVQVIKSFVTGIKKNAKTISKAFADALGSIATGVLDVLPDLVEAGGELLISLAEGITQKIPDLVSKLKDTISSLAQTITRMAPDFVRAAHNLIVTIGNNLKYQLPSMVKSVTEILLTLVKSFLSIKTDLMKVGLELIEALGQGIIDSLPLIVDALPQIINGIVDFFITKYTLMAEIGVNLLTALLESLPSIIQQIGAKLPELIQGIGEKLVSFIGYMAEIGGELFSALIDNLPEIFSAIWEAVKGVDWIGLGSMLLGAILQGLASIGSKLLELFTGAKTSVEGIDWSTLAGSIINGIISLPGKILELFTQGKSDAEALTWSDVGTSVETGLKSVLDAGGTFLGGLFEAGKAAVLAIPWGSVGEIIGQGVHGVIDVGGAFLSGGFEAAKTAVLAIDWTTLGTTIGGAINQTIDVAGQFLSGCFDAAHAAIQQINWSALGTTIGDAVNGTIDTAGAFLSGCFTTAKSAIEAIDWNNLGTVIGNGVNNTIDTAGAFLSGCFTSAKTAIEKIDWANIGTTIGNAINNTIDTAGAFLSGCFETAKTAIEGINWSGIGTVISTGINGVIDVHGAFLKGSFDAAKTAIEGIQWGNIGSTISTAINGYIDTAGAFLSGAFSAAKTTIEGINWNDLGSAVAGGVNSAIDAAGTFLSAPFEAGAALIQGINWDSIGNDIANGLSRAWGIVTGLGDVALGLGETVVGGLQAGVSWLRSVMGLDSNGGTTDAEKIGQDAATEVTKGVNEKLPDAVQAATDLAASLYDTLKEKLKAEVMKPLGEGIVTAIDNGITEKGTAANLATCATSLKDAVYSAIETAIGGFSGTNFNAIGTSIIAGVEKGVRDASKEATFSGSAGDLKSAAEAALNTAIGSSSSGLNATQFNAIGKGIVAGIEKGQKDASIEAVFSLAAAETFRAALAALKTAIGGDSGTKFNIIGTAICQGIAQGIRSGTSIVTAAATSAAYAAYNAAKARLQINSPSKVFSEIGRYTMLGMAEGIDDNAQRVIQSMNRVSDSLTGADVVAKMQSAVASATGGIAEQLSDRPYIEAQEDEPREEMDYTRLARAIWEEAPELDVNIDGQKAGTILEPHISKRQGSKTNAKNRRNGNV